MKRLIIVVPCYNEQEVLPQSTAQLVAVVKDLIKKGKVAENSGILLCNDGSYDNTWNIIRQMHQQYPCVYGLNLSANVGHQNVLFAGLETAYKLCDVTVSIDADLQDDVKAIEQMVDCYLNGADVVFGVRSDRSSDSVFKRATARGFYRLMNALGVQTVFDHADFRLMSSRAVQALCCYEERNLFLRGMVVQLGYQTEKVYYQRKPRTAGKSKYPLKKMLALAWQGITSFSIKPISLIAWVGGMITAGAVVAFLVTLITALAHHTSFGYGALITSIWFLGGVQLLAIGLVGQYVGKTYLETKKRPRYNIESTLLDPKDESGIS